MSNISNTLFMGKVLIQYKSLKSTNLEAQRLLAAGPLIEGTTIVASLQTEGKGQRGNTWHSPADTNLLSSFILLPKFLLPRQQFMLNIITSLAMVDLLESLSISNVHIKWPNDIYIGKLKVAGMLIQNNISAQAIQSSIIGIGLNVNQKKFDPKLPNPTSLKLHLGYDLDLISVLKQLCYFLEKRYLQLKNDSNHTALLQQYTERLYRLGKVATYLVEGKPVPGIIEGIDPIGKLVLRMDDGTRVFDFQEVKFLG